ncbi:hypothetical protein [Xenorhabdus siamensis]|uniref:hypothetical protein n=1 Tax=Xenorhabdus siamensis TaxID=3136254 RepID=UPI0030F467EE
MLQLLHHLIGDHETMEVMHREVQAYLAGQEESLPARRLSVIWWRRQRQWL